MTSVEELWQQRLTEARVRCGRGLDPERLAERYDAATAEEIRQLTNQGVKEVLRGGHAVLTLDDLDAAAEKLEEASEKILTDGGVDQPSSGSQHAYLVRAGGRCVLTEDYSLAYEYGTGRRLGEGDPVDDDREDRISIVHTRAHEYVLDLSQDSKVIERQECCLNRRYDCGHVAYGPPRRLPSECPECSPQTDTDHSGGESA